MYAVKTFSENNMWNKQFFTEILFLEIVIHLGQAYSQIGPGRNFYVHTIGEDKLHVLISTMAWPHERNSLNFAWKVRNQKLYFTNTVGEKEIKNLFDEAQKTPSSGERLNMSRTRQRLILYKKKAPLGLIFICFHHTVVMDYINLRLYLFSDQLSLISNHLNHDSDT